MVNQPSFIWFFGQNGLIFVLRLLVGHIADQIVSRLTRLIIFLSKNINYCKNLTNKISMWPTNLIFFYQLTRSSHAYLLGKKSGFLVQVIFQVLINIINVLEIKLWCLMWYKNKVSWSKNGVNNDEIDRNCIWLQKNLKYAIKLAITRDWLVQRIGLVRTGLVYVSPGQRKRIISWERLDFCLTKCYLVKCQWN